MKKFKYSLENVLKIRYKNENKKLNDMSISLNKYLDNVNTKKSMTKKIVRIIDEMNTEKILNIRYQKYYYLYLEKSRLELEEQKRIVKQVKTDYESKKEDYIKAQMDRKVIEKHKGKYIEMINMEIKEEEEQMFNELAIVSFNRKKCQ